MVLLVIRMPGVGIMSLVGTDHRVATQRANEEGCSMRGSLLVNKVEGNFHIAVGILHFYYFPYFNMFF